MELVAIIDLLITGTVGDFVALIYARIAPSQRMLFLFAGGIALLIGGGWFCLPALADALAKPTPVVTSLLRFFNSDMGKISLVVAVFGPGMIGHSARDILAYFFVPKRISIEENVLVLDDQRIPLSENAVTQVLSHDRMKLRYGENGASVILYPNLLSDGEHFRECLEAKLGEIIGSAVSKRMDHGETVSFGAVSLDRNGLYFKNRFYPFTDIENIFGRTVHDPKESNFLIFRLEDRQIKVDRKKLLNEAALFYALSQRLVTLGALDTGTLSYSSARHQQSVPTQHNFYYSPIRVLLWLMVGLASSGVVAFLFWVFATLDKPFDSFLWGVLAFLAAVLGLLLYTVVRPPLVAVFALHKPFFSLDHEGITGPDGKKIAWKSVLSNTFDAMGPPVIPIMSFVEIAIHRDSGKALTKRFSTNLVSINADRYLDISNMYRLG